MGRKSTTGGISPNGDRIAIRFTWNGKEIRPTLNLKPNAANLKHATKQRAEILVEIKAGTFSLARYFPDYKFASDHEAPDDISNRTLKRWAAVWSAIAVRDLEYSTLEIYKRHLECYWLSKFGSLHPRAVTYEKIALHLAELAEPEVGKGLSRKTQNNILTPLRAVFELLCKSAGAPANPCLGIENLKIQKPKPDPFTLSEVDAALDHIRKDEREGAAMADYYEFAAFAGLRPSEQIALRWEDVDLLKNEVKVHRARVMSRDKARTKTVVERVVELNSRAAAVLDRQRPRTQLAGGDVFINPVTRAPYHDEQFQAREWMRALRMCGIRHRPPKELRDTSVSQALSAGAEVYYVAQQHGHSVTTMLKDYAKWIPKADQGRNIAAINASLGGFRTEPALRKS